VLFRSDALAGDSGDIAWAKVLELLAVNRLLEPRSELSIHEKFFPQTALDILLDTDARVASKDRLYRCLDRIAQHKTALEKHLAQKWKDLFNATYDILLYDLTSTYLEGAATEVPHAKRGYSRDHRPDCKQLVIALIVTPEGFPLTYEIFPGNTIDHTTLAHILDQVETKHGKARRVWVFDRGIVTEDNLKVLRERGAHYLVGTPKHKLRDHEQKLLNGPWQKAGAKVQVQLCPEDDETYVLCRSQGRREKESAMRRRAETAAILDLRKLRKRIASGKLKNETLIHEQIGRLRERHKSALKHIEPTYQPAAAATPETPARPAALTWKWDIPAHRAAVLKEGAYLLRAHWPQMDKDPEKLWQTYTQLTNAEAAFRTIKSEVKVRPIWHWTQKRVEAHIMVAFLGYCLWVCLKKNCECFAPSLTPWALLDQLRRIQLVEVWFETREGRSLCLPRITQPEFEQKVLLTQLGWKLPEQPPPRVYAQPQGKEEASGKAE
jgi:transposase